ncbi:MAG TPA: hypothetical protein VH302_04985 [Bryobacteraceae bacterium]|nr:hypothetical protein [Bryobacteraceae bacterium]
MANPLHPGFNMRSERYTLNELARALTADLHQLLGIWPSPSGSFNW